MADGPSSAGGFLSRMAAYSRAALTLGIATPVLLAQEAARLPAPSDDDVAEANRPRPQWQLPDQGTGPTMPPPTGATTGVRVGGGPAAVMTRASALNPALAGAGLAAAGLSRPLAQAAVTVGNAVANVAHDVRAVVVNARAPQGRSVGGRGGPDDRVPARVPDPMLGRDVDMNAAINACRAEIAGLNQAQRENIGMRTAADIENHFNGNVGAIHSRYAEIAGNPEKTASLERLTKMANQRDTYFPAGYRVQARILDNGEVALRFVRGSTERPAPTFPWRSTS